MNDDDLHMNALTERIIGAAFDVSNTLGLAVAQQRGISVYYKDFVVGEYAADLIAEDAIIVELKVVRSLNEFHVAQCVNDLRATGKATCLLMNFARPRLEFRRVVR